MENQAQSEADRRWARAVEAIVELQEASDETLTKFTESMANDRIYALQWSCGAFEAAGALAVTREVLRGIERCSDRKVVYATVLSEVVRSARDASQSTSFTSNAIADAKRAAWARVFEFVARGIGEEV